MKKIIALLLFFGTVSFLSPYSWMLLSKAYSQPGVAIEDEQPQEQESTQFESIQPGESELPEESLQANKAKFSEFTIYCNDRSNVVIVSSTEYLIGALAVEMTLSSPIEALKAQTVAAYSYAVARAENKEASETPMNADFSATPSQYEGFATEEELKHLWGDGYEENYKYLSDIVNSVLGEAVLYEGKAALSCYFPLSNGKTLPSDLVFGTELPYLISVESPYDTHSPEYMQKITFTAQQIYDVLMVEFPNTELKGEPIEWFTAPAYNDYGYLTEITAGGVVIPSDKLRECLGLRSNAIQIEFVDDVFIFTTQGMGHGVGMSQYSAKMMAENGYTYRDILGYFYPGTTVELY